MGKEKKLNSFSDVLFRMADFVQKNYYMNAISSGFAMLMPILMIGCFAQIIGMIPITPWTDFLAATGVVVILNAVNTLTIGCLSVYAAFIMAYLLAKSYKKDALTAATIALFCFFIVTPLVEGTSLDMTYMGAQGLFSAMLVSLVSTKLWCVLMGNKRLLLKLPDSVPEAVGKAFASLLPSIIVAFLFMSVQVLFSHTSFGSLSGLIYTVVGKPLSGLGNSIWSMVILCLVMQLFWFLGVHGTTIIMPVLSTVFTPLSALNMEMVAAGVPNSELYILDSGFFRAFVGIGGCGGVISLLLAILIVGRSKQYRTMGKMCIIPTFFGISEPTVFGLPVVLNPFLAIPFITVPAIQAFVAWAVISVGLVPHPYGAWAPFGTPILLNSLPVAGWQGLILQLFLIVLGMLIYIPFVKMMDRRAVKEEKESKV